MERAVEQAERGDISYAPYYMDLGINEMKKIIDNPAYSRGYKYSLHALIDMSIKYLNISEKNMEMNEAQYIQEKIIAIPKCELIIIRHYEDISFMKEATEEDYLVENLDWEEQLNRDKLYRIKNNNLK